MKIVRKISVSKKLLISALGMLAIAAATRGQESAAATPVYEVASIKPTKSANGNGFMRIGFSYSPDGLTAENVNLQMLIQMAYGVGKDRLSGAPEWFNSDRYDIDAKMDGETAEAQRKLTADELKIVRQHMLQALLADRFKLSVHSETKELAVYNLVIAKGGLKLQQSKPDDKDKASDGTRSKEKDKGSDGGGSKPSSNGGPQIRVDGGEGGKTVSIGSGGRAVAAFSGRGGTRTMSGKGVTIQNLLTSLSSATGRPVLNKTGLTGKYDYKLEWAPDDNQATAPGGPPSGAAPIESEPSGPNIFTAVQEQLGLKLESARGPVQIFVIEHAEKASGN
jgi:uncharacterized protein (TIGR03435 family)